MENNCKETCISKILEFILELQKNTECPNIDNVGCDKPCLGPSINGYIYNTRPITLYCCSTGTLWSMPYTLNGETGTSTVFKINKVDCNCATFEILAPNPDTENTIMPYLSTNNFFTINLDCVLAIRCLNDTYTN
ncbi:MAG: hypothetical protein MR266_05660 [Erysipelotrichaceae bacterium]|nr:hypothetical protein [Erysipelotrichaceae bacterium]